MAAVSVIGCRSYTGGRGRGILGLDLPPEFRKPGESRNQPGHAMSPPSESPESAKVTQLMKVLVACYDYKANPNAPGGFSELSIKKGDLLEYVAEHPSNEHWWQAKNEDGEIGFVPASYVLVKEEQMLPWLAESALETREKERKERLQRQSQQQALIEGKGFGPPPKDLKPAQPYVYVSAYNREGQAKSSGSGSGEYYCDVCEKSFNGPKPYKAHMASRAHREELEFLQEQEN